MNGLPCRHIAHVLKYYFSNFSGFLLEDVDLRFHNLYAYYVGYSPPDNLDESMSKIRDDLLKLRKQTENFLPQISNERMKLLQYDPSKDVAVGSAIDFPAENVSTHISCIEEFAVLALNYTQEQMNAAKQSHCLGGFFHEDTNLSYDDDVG